MTQTAFNGEISVGDSWELISEVNCTFAVVSGSIEIIGMDGAAPASSDVTGIPYAFGEAEAATTDTLGRFVGAGTADRIYAIARGGSTAKIFLSRAAVA